MKKRAKKNVVGGETPMQSPPQNTIELYTSGDIRKLNHTLFNKKPNKGDYEDAVMDSKVPSK